MKPVEFCGQSLEAIRQFPTAAKRECGHQLDRVQRGLDPQDWKPVSQIGPGVREIRVQDRGQFRVIYVAKFEDAVYVLHAFHKKTQQIRTADLDSARRQYQSVLKRFEK